MSEYQYYEFRAIDRPLSEPELRKLRALSTRAEITPTSFTNTYEWGDFKGDPYVLMKKFFDAFVYVANWGTRRLMLRVPGSDYLDAFSVYARGEGVGLQSAGELVIVELQSEEEDSEWEDGDGWMASLIPLRADLMRGDCRCLYLGWLRSAQDGEFDEDDFEPPVPPGLGSLTAALKALIDFLSIDNDLVEAAAMASSPTGPGTSRDDLAAWLRQMPETQKDELLLDAALNNTLNLQAELLKHYSKYRPITEPPGPPETARRTVGQLVAAAEEIEERKTRIAAELKAAEESRLAKQAAEERAQRLDRLEGREPIAWNQVTDLILTKRPTDYARAIDLLVDLRDLAKRRGEDVVFETAIRRFRETHASKRSLLRRLAEAKL